MLLSLLPVSIVGAGGSEKRCLWKRAFDSLCIILKFQCKRSNLNYYPSKYYYFHIQHFRRILAYPPSQHHCYCLQQFPTTPIKPINLLLKYLSMEANVSTSQTLIGSKGIQQRLSYKRYHPELDFKDKYANQNLQRKSLHSSQFHTKTLIAETLTHHKRSRKDYDTLSVKEQNGRGYSLRNTSCLKGSKQQNIGERGLYDYNEELLKLKLEEMIFKFKTRIGALLKEIDISVAELGKFTNLNRIDEILDFLNEKVRARLFKKQANQSITDRLRIKEKELLGDYELQIEALKRKQHEKDGIEKGYKVKLKEAHNQIRELYDRVNQKERELSLKMTEIYQLKSISKESEKLIDNYKHKCQIMEREIGELKQKQNSQSKKLFGQAKRYEEMNAELTEKNEELNDLLERQAQKEEKILQLNHHLQEELERWRERFQSERTGETQTASQSLSSNKEKNAESHSHHKLERKISDLSLGNQLDRLHYKVKELEKQNRSLLRELSNYNGMKERYEELKSCMESPRKDTFTPEGQPKSMELSEGERFEIEYNCRKKIEEVAKQWKDKLIEIVNNYENEGDKNTKQMQKLRKENQQLEAKVYQLANEKYLVQNKLIEKERELSELNRINKNKISTSKIQKAESESKSQTISEQKQKKVKSQVG